MEFSFAWQVYPSVSRSERGGDAPQAKKRLRRFQTFVQPHLHERSKIVNSLFCGKTRRTARKADSSTRLFSSWLWTQATLGNVCCGCGNMNLAILHRIDANAEASSGFGSITAGIPQRIAPGEKRFRKPEQTNQQPKHLDNERRQIELKNE